MTFEDALKLAELSVTRNGGLLGALDVLAKHGFPVVERQAIVSAYNDLSDERMDAALKGVVAK